MQLSARAAADADFEGAEALVEDAGDASAAREWLEDQGAVTGDGDSWAARVEVDGDPVLLRGDAGSWSIWAPAGSEPSDTAMAARRIHGYLGVKHDGWELDR